MRIAYVTSHPIQYQAPLFRALTVHPEVSAFKAFFSWDFGVRETVDPGFGRPVLWDIPLLDGYDHVFLPNLSRTPGVERFTGLLNPSIFGELRAFRPDMIAVHGYAHATEHFAMLAGRLLRVPVWLRGESNLLPERPHAVRAAKRLGSLYLRGLLTGALAIGTHSRAYFRHYGFPDARIVTVPYVVDNAFFQARSAEAHATAARWRAELGISPEATVVGFAAKLSPVKACGDLIEAFGRACSHRPDAALVIFGDGPLRAELEAHAARFPNASIHFRGFINQSEMPAAYATSDVFVLPSTYEPWGLAVNEAMNLGKPVIVSEAVSCAVDLIGPDNGRVFPVGDVDRLAALLSEACGDRTQLRAMGAASLARISRWGIPEAAEGLVAAGRSSGSAPGSSGRSSGSAPGSSGRSSGSAPGSSGRSSGSAPGSPARRGRG
jgi:glycosyltransferase involved in cell wall biosynthesis